ncbi:hypothetical protein [Roseimicrobium sp. ORNL1]|uniref:hypothetical protein n=1 Tax=Roseimicrobium sp. ORNL1 TaxID=2711231 RepID=UPI0013E17395|nr:hypothetical protein [Roseimicrobium sp. ORNL1]QIF01160.1 hypothetical protein G5S37_06380 [Roseimicrobium sp. ORNL1]
MGTTRTLMVSMMRAAVAAVLCGAGFTSCASFQKEKSGAELRKEGYEALLKTVKAGMYRRQLYAVLPPCEKPKAQPPSFCGIGGVTMYWAHQETHKLDPECHLTVCYQLKNGGEYRRRNEWALRTTKPPATKPFALTPDTIDALLKAEAFVLTEFAEDEVPSKENPDDIIMSISGVHLTSPLSKQIPMEITISPTQQQGFILGRRTEKGPDLPMTVEPAKTR